jgi:hypothetical protein
MGDRHPLAQGKGSSGCSLTAFTSSSFFANMLLIVSIVLLKS